MATRKGATKTVGGKRFRYNGSKWVQIKATGNVTPTSSSNRSARSNKSTAQVTDNANRPSRGGIRTTTDTQRTSTGSARVTTKPKALPPGKKGGALSGSNRPRRTNINSNTPSSGTRTATGSPPKPVSKPKKPSLGNRAYVKARQAGINPTRLTNAISKNANVKRLSGATTAVALLAQGLAATPGPTGRRVKANLEKQDKDRNSTIDMSMQKGREVLQTLGLVDRKTKPTTTKPTVSKPNNAAEINASLKKERAEKDRALEATTTPPKPPVPKDTPKPDPRASTAPPRAGSGGSGGGRSAPAPIPKKTGANDPRNAAYISARSKLNSNSTQAERDKVRDIGMDIHNKTFGKKPSPTKTKPTKAKPTKQSAAQNLRTGRSPDPIPKKKKKKKEVLPYFGGNGIGRY